MEKSSSDLLKSVSYVVEEWLKQEAETSVKWKTFCILMSYLKRIENQIFQCASSNDASADMMIATGNCLSKEKILDGLVENQKRIQKEFDERFEVLKLEQKL